MVKGKIKLCITTTKIEILAIPIIGTSRSSTRIHIALKMSLDSILCRFYTGRSIPSLCIECKNKIFCLISWGRTSRLLQSRFIESLGLLQVSTLILQRHWSLFCIGSTLAELCHQRQCMIKPRNI